MKTTTIERELEFEGDDSQIDRPGREPIGPPVFASSYHATGAMSSVMSSTSSVGSSAPFAISMS
jgi:hypothetical protein